MMQRLWLGTVLLAGCLVENPDYRAPPDLRPCPNYPVGGGGGQNRPEVLVPGGMYRIDGVMFQVKDFYLDVFEVTVAAYRQCRSAGACTTDPQTGSSYNWTAAPGTREDHPINGVTWEQADEFCRWAGRRLPTEGEWEYAAAGMGASPYPWGSDAPDKQLCWARTWGMGTCPVGSFGKTLLGAPNCGGVADLAGNVWEWTATEYKKPYAQPELICSKSRWACSLRGGSWDSSDPNIVQAVYRNLATPDYRYISVGFRCARNAQ
ncbi:MAG: formylglycine-generating enzyme family protein [Myxococcota bacterium]|nr:formylglycine-generating enzyme family protein [Myxococcota bacterium]